MRCLFLVVLLYVVRCEDGNYYVIQVPRNEPQRTLKVYWNVPTMQCKSKKVIFENLYQKYGIHQNDGDQFRGEMVTIMYDPGLFPALLKNETSGKFKFRNGGVPQEGDLDKHLEAFRKDLDLSIPDRNFKGIAIIDFESWRPIYRQNFGVLSPYKDVSYEIERKLHWWWSKSSIEAEAKRRFESSARTFMESTISLARQLRPGGVWGFYGFPYCFNMASNNLVERCANNVPQENDRLSWLWRSSTALYPSIYSPTSLSTSQLTALIRGRVQEARRVKRGVVLPYFWYRYRDGGFLTQTDLNAALNELYNSNASGFIIWGSSNDVNTLDKCKKLYNYVHNIFGPAIAKYTKKSLRDEVIDGNNNTTIDNNQIDASNNATIDLNNRIKANDSDVSDEIHFVNKRNSTDDLNSTYDIKKTVQKEIIKKFTNYVPINEDNTSEDEEAVLKDNNVLIDLIINSILNREFNSLNKNNNESTTEYNLTNATNESSLITKDNIENTYNIDENNNYSDEKQSTTVEGTVSTTETIKITSNDMQIIDYNYKESHKETTQIDTTTEYNLDEDVLYDRNFTETAVTNRNIKNSDFNVNANDGTENFDILRTLRFFFTTTENTESTVEYENNFLNKQDVFVNNFTVEDISITENMLQYIEKDIFTTMNTDIDKNKTELNETKSEFTNETKFKDIDKESTENITEEDFTTESNYDFDTFNETNSIGKLLTNSEIFTTESQYINTKPNSDVEDQKTTTDYANFDKTSTTSTEDYAVFDETTVPSTINTLKDESKSFIENSQKTISYANFDETTATSTAADSKSSIEDGTTIVNSHESTNYSNFDETSIAADSKNSTEENTMLKNSHKTTNYNNFDETTISSIAVDSEKSTEEGTAVVKNALESINYTDFDETTATSTASPKTDSQSSMEDSTAVSTKEDKVVVYVL